MRVGGLASGIETDSIIRDLMQAERIPLNKLEQNKTQMEWKRDAFREVNMQISELERMITDIRLDSSTLNPKTVTSSMEGAVTASANSSAGAGSYNISVEKLATNAMQVTEIDKETFDNYIADNAGEVVKFYTYEEPSREHPEGGMAERSFTINEGDSVQQVVRSINNADSNVRAFYDEVSGQFMMETTRSGDYNTTDAYEGAEIGFKSEDSSFFTEILGFKHSEEIGGKNAQFTYNDVVELESKDNRYTLNGITFQFHDVTSENQNARLTVNNDVDAAVENITEFVDKYNELVLTLQGSQNEPVHRDYPPLTDEQMEEMTDRQIELWEEKARSGLLKGERAISDALTNMRSTMYNTVENNGAFNLLTEIGISTTENYLDGGLLEIDEDTLRGALEEDANSVHQLLVNGGEGAERGVLNRLEDSLETTIGRIEERAGKGSFTNEMFTIGRELNDIDGRIEAFERRMQQTEDRYWRQFNAMEQAISMMNNQSAMLMNFGGNTM